MVGQVLGVNGSFMEEQRNIESIMQGTNLGFLLLDEYLAKDSPGDFVDDAQTLCSQAAARICVANKRRQEKWNCTKRLRRLSFFFFRVDAGLDNVKDEVAVPDSCPCPSLLDTCSMLPTR